MSCEVCLFCVVVDYWLGCYVSELMGVGVDIIYFGFCFLFVLDMF